MDDGAVFVDGKQIGKIEARRRAQAIIETPGFLPGYSARQNQFLAGITGRRKKEIDEAIESRTGSGKRAACQHSSVGMHTCLVHRRYKAFPPSPGRIDERSTTRRAGDAAVLKLKRRKNDFFCGYNREDIAALCDTTVE